MSAVGCAPGLGSRRYCSTMVDWSLARQIARFSAGDAPIPDLGVDLHASAAEAELEVGRYTGLEGGGGTVPPPEVVARGDWAEINLVTLASLLDPVGRRLEGRLDAAGPLAGALRTVAGATLAAEAGLVLGYMSQRVLGQYEVSLLQPEQPARLLFVGPNLTGAASEMAVDRVDFLRWVVFHEMTHAFQFASVSWLRDHLGGLLREYMASVEVRIERGAAGGLPSMPNPADIVRNFREGGLAALVQTREQRKIVARVQAAMAIVEGYSEHVMDAVGAKLLTDYEGLRRAMDNRRSSRSAPERVLQRLLGLDQKLRQYEIGKRFCDEVVAREGIDALNHVWASPEALPSTSELERPRAWLVRVARDGAAAA
jgi:coenzyme F420 biosynthesis associated uncharacterized protein